MKFASKNSLDQGREIPDFTKYEPLPEADRFPAFLASWIKPRIQTDMRNYYDSGQDPDQLPDNRFYRRQVERAGFYFGYPFLQMLEKVALRTSQVEQLPTKVRQAVERLQDFEQFGGKGAFQRASDIVEFHDYLVDNLDDFASAIEKFEEESCGMTK